jgi:signal recognition particle subunit SRP54
MALLEADVALPVVKQFVEAVKQRALGQEVMSSLSPGQAFLKIVQAELEAVMGSANEALDLAAQPPAVILLAGLQGAGKTTSAAKLARCSRSARARRSPLSAPTCTARRR